MEHVKKFFEWEEERWKSQAVQRQPTVTIGDTAVTDVMLASESATKHQMKEKENALLMHRSKERKGR
jgi:hypothetical protein